MAGGQEHESGRKAQRRRLIDDALNARSTHSKTLWLWNVKRRPGTATFSSSWCVEEGFWNANQPAVEAGLTGSLSAQTVGVREALRIRRYTASSPGVGGFPRPARFRIRFALPTSPRCPRSRKYSSSVEPTASRRPRH